jgi:hypothetical protein
VYSVTCRTWATREIRHYFTCFPTTCAFNVDEVNVRNVDFARILCTGRLIDVEVALIQHNRTIGVFDVDVFVSNVVDISVPNVRPCPRFQARAILAIEEGYIFDPCIGDVVFHTRILSDRAHADAVSAITPEVLDKDIGGVGFGGETIVTDIDAGVGDGETIDIEGVEAICVLGKRLR